MAEGPATKDDSEIWEDFQDDKGVEKWSPIVDYAEYTEGGEECKYTKRGEECKYTWTHSDEEYEKAFEGTTPMDFGVEIDAELIMFIPKEMLGSLPICAAVKGHVEAYHKVVKANAVGDDETQRVSDEEALRVDEDPEALTPVERKLKQHYDKIQKILSAAKDSGKLGDELKDFLLLDSKTWVEQPMDLDSKTKWWEENSWDEIPGELITPSPLTQ